MVKYNTISYQSVQEIPKVYFEQIGCSDSFYYSQPFLNAFEKANAMIDIYYIIFLQKKQAVALAIVQSLDVNITGASATISTPQKLLQHVKSYINAHKTRILICGNIFLSGSYGLIVKKGIEERSIYATLSRKLKTLPTKKSARILLFKDYNEVQQTRASVIEKEGYQSFAVEPNMKIEMKWKNFEIYKAHLKSKYRIKINRADKVSKGLQVQRLTAKEIGSVDRELTILYKNVTKRSSFNAAYLSIKTYQMLKEYFPKNVYVTSYRKDDKIVGFSTAFHVENKLDTHFIGLDYQYNKTYAIYPRILNDHLRLGFELSVSEVNLGRTASEIKSTLGATPEHLHCYIKHKRTIANLFFKPLIRHIKLTAYKQHQPFKT